MQTMDISYERGHEANCFSISNWWSVLCYPIVHNLLLFLLRGDYLKKSV